VSRSVEVGEAARDWGGRRGGGGATRPWPKKGAGERLWKELTAAPAVGGGREREGEVC
jgi:hypothetical protein